MGANHLAIAYAPLNICNVIDLTLTQTLEVFQLLTLTYSRYVDAPSREAVEAVGIELVRRDELRGTPEGEQDAERMGVTEQIVGWLAQEVDRMAKRPRCVVQAIYADRKFMSCVVAHIRLQTCLSCSAGALAYTLYALSTTLISPHLSLGARLLEALLLCSI